MLKQQTLNYQVFARQKEEMKKAKEAEEKAVQDKKAKAAEGKEALGESITLYCILVYHSHSIV